MLGLAAYTDGCYPIRRFPACYLRATEEPGRYVERLEAMLTAEQNLITHHGIFLRSDSYVAKNNLRVLLHNVELHLTRLRAICIRSDTPETRPNTTATAIQVTD